THKVEDASDWHELAERYGPEAAAEIVHFRNSWKRNYTRVAVIDTGCSASDDCMRLAGRIAENLGWECERLTGSIEMLRDLVAGNWDSRRFLVLEPGQRSEASGDTQVLLAVSPGAPAVVGPAEGRSAVEVIGRPGGGPSGLGLGIDAGGTYTDAVIYDFDAGRVVSKAKSLTTPHDPLIGIEGALDGLNAPLMGRVRLVALSTTFATNAIVESRGGEPGCIVMPAPGFDADDLRWPHHAIIGGRMTIGGEETEPFDADGCRTAVRRLLDAGVDSFAISGYGSVRNPAHELAARELIGEICELPVVCGHELSARLNFVNRANTAALNARLLPLIARLLDAAQRSLHRCGVQAPLMVVKGDGSLINMATALERPIETVLSGPAASVFGAHHLGRAENAAVVDIGGTTTDSALIVEGRPRLSPEGARVGGWQTSVEAVEIATIGLGGDSALDFNADRDLLVGPRRAVPLCLLAMADPEPVLRNLDRLFHDDRVVRTNASALDMLMAGPTPVPAGLSASEREIVARVAEGPVSRRELAAALGLASARLLRTGRLEDRGVLQRSALTPTDLLHVTGEFDPWHREAARAGLAAFAHLFGRPPEEIISRVRQRMTRMLCEVLIGNELAGHLTLEEELAGSAGLRLVMDRMLSGGGGALGFAVRYGRPVVAIGAPAHVFLPPVGERLGCEVVVPEHAEVANAVGAVVSHVSVSQMVAIRPSEFDSFAVYAPGGRREFERLDEAINFASGEAEQVARTRALAAGAADPGVEVQVEHRLGRLATGEEQLIEVRVCATAWGHPLTAVPDAAAS
ncbi:MAG TPA: hydantoinase/oxoprolinase family protein, partial [Armatimonadota bacterium]|nr:hydantoinase/oxoprolinase family protein [Armatimonadota bacterium]